MMASVQRRPRDSDDDIETRVFKRPPPLGLDRTMIMQIMRELEPQRHARQAQKAPTPLRAPAMPVRPKTRAPNVFLTPRTPADPLPPWAQPVEKTGTRVRVVRQRTKLPWFAFVVMFAITFGVLQDPVLRRETAAQITSAAVSAYSSTIRLFSFVSRMRT